ncbi:hypothetical protein J2Z69_000055 [Paenibacillus shirakamiensis]|uniref:Uncharacterized protein n=1 Tax=Paenibacillus shirakamiensis TaxID=1265935 RepID=A0ABS4JD49_9BACL|nr:hypothetical protein [Paenibacillus shirakamiensis]
MVRSKYSCRSENLLGGHIIESAGDVDEVESYEGQAG